MRRLLLLALALSLVGSAGATPTGRGGEAEVDGAGESPSLASSYFSTAQRHMLTRQGAGSSDLAPIAYVGCSNTRMTVQGYELAGGSSFWPTPGSVYNGGTVPRWAAGYYWSQFGYLEAQGGKPAAIWLQVCLLSTESNLDADIAAGVRVILELNDREPGVPIYVSALSSFPDHVCKLTGANGPATAQKVADWLVAHGLALPGPAMPGLTIGLTRGDGCHPNPDGAALEGDALREFFG